ncbi:asparaginase domain-containing protein [Nitrosophilus alvini]|uniref:asparaginase domain-containing protein n=1 Tax=Nitrosophilus alvini TaxID=2714855 RepID=UPI001F193C90|nr:asparaginase domain-containing protein [Nitrosophilus alvini]
MLKEILILNTGGTFNKIYEPKTGRLIVPKSNIAVEKILSCYKDNIDYILEGIIFKDSLEMNESDREQIADEIEKRDNDLVIVVHGTDTMDKSAAYVSKRVKDRCIIFTGSMIPFGMDPTEAAANFSLALSKLILDPQPGVFIAMHGLVLPYDKIFKDKKEGAFRKAERL